MGHLQHYRVDCVGALKKSCAKEYKKVSGEDKNLWRFKDKVVAEMTETLGRLGFFRSSSSSQMQPMSATGNVDP